MDFNAETVDTTQSLLNVNMINITKFNSTNFMTWNLQVHSLLYGYDLDGFLDGSTAVPAQTIIIDGQHAINPA